MILSSTSQFDILGGPTSLANNSHWRSVSVLISFIAYFGLSLLFKFPRSAQSCASCLCWLWDYIYIYITLCLPSINFWLNWGTNMDIKEKIIKSTQGGTYLSAKFCFTNYEIWVLKKEMLVSIIMAWGNYMEEIGLSHILFKWSFCFLNQSVPFLKTWF